MNNLGFCALIAAAFSFAACQADEPAMIENESVAKVIANFGAEVTEPAATKATLTPNDAETAFAADWETGDKIAVSYYALDSEAEEYEGAVDASWNGSSFSANLPDINAVWEYRACYPSAEGGNVDFGGQRTQKGKEYNSMYDLMTSSTVYVEDAPAGKMDDGSDIVFPMKRETAIVRFHFTSSLQVPVTSATLSVKGSSICAESTLLDPSGVLYDDYGSEIELELDGQNSDDFVLWFNVLPCSFDEMTIKVETLSKSFILTRGEGTFDEGMLYNINMDVPDDKWQKPESITNPVYALVESEPADWSGTYLAAYVVKNEAKVYTGVDAVSNFETTSIVDDEIQRSGSMAELKVEAVAGGYSVMIVGGANNGKYLAGSSSNGTIFSDTPSAGNFKFNSGGTVLFSTNNTSTSFQFNSADDQQRFRFFGSSQKKVSFFKKSSTSNPGEDAATTVMTYDASNIGQANAVLTGSYVASATPSEVGFVWGTSESNLDNELYVDSGSGLSGSFSKNLSSLSPSTEYWFRSYVIVDGNYFYGDVLSFVTKSVSSGEGSQTAYAKSWLAGYEVPATNVAISESDMMYQGRYCHSTVTESYGGTSACIYNTDSSSERIVTHTYSYNDAVYANYTMLYDQSKHCALWEAFVLGGTENKDNGVGRNDSWGYDPAIPTSWQPRLKSSYSGYTRGHAIASNYRQTTTSQNKQTFYYSNMTPQASSLNSGVWNTLEQKVKGLSTQLGSTSRLYVVTGPVFDSGYKTTTDPDGLRCPVPTRYFKCIMMCEFNSKGEMTSAKGAGYMFNHTGDTSRQDMTIDQVEAETGFDFFANVPDSIENSAEANCYHFF